MPLLSRAKAIGIRAPVDVVAVTTFEPPRVTSAEDATFIPCAIGVGVAVAIGAVLGEGVGVAEGAGVGLGADVADALGVGVALFTGSGTPLPQTNFPAFFTQVNFWFR